MNRNTEFKYITERQSIEGFHSDLLEEMIEENRKIEAHPEVVKTDNKTLQKGKIVYGIVLIIVSILTLLMMNSLMKARTTIELNTLDAYGVHEEDRGLGYLWIFPKEIGTRSTASDYYYYHQESYFGVTYQVYLSHSWSPEDFDKEVLRLSRITDEKSPRIKGNDQIVYNTDDFVLPAYVTVYNDQRSYEYALINRSNYEIIYVYIENVDLEAIHFNHEYLPNDYTNKIGQDSYNIYLDAYREKIDSQ